MTDLEMLKRLGPQWQHVLVHVVEQSVFAWLCCGDSRMVHDNDLYEMYAHALLVLEGLKDVTQGSGNLPVRRC